MVYTIGVRNLNNKVMSTPAFKAEADDKKGVCENHDTLMYQEFKMHPVTTSLKIQKDKLSKAFTTYPKKGLKGSKNANFYEFLTMGTVPYLVGSATMISVFNLASRFFDVESAKNASKLGKKMGLGVLFYGIAKTLSKKFIETPVKAKYGIDVNLPYKKVINELPEEDNQNNLVSYEYHKAFESVDFPRWDLFYNNKDFGERRNAYFLKVGKKLGINDSDLEHADQKVKPAIKEKVIKTRLFSTLSSYLWAATGVGVAMQKPWENFSVNIAERLKHFKDYRQIAQNAKLSGVHAGKYTCLAQDFGKKFIASCKEFVNGENAKTNIAGRILLGAAVGMTLLGNFSTLFNFNKYRGQKPNASSSLIDESKEKVVC